ncbi:HAD-IIIC family phosphatase [Uliginosibacterium sp. H3]|uniref:HAD-IIIC family phosphatase n=1 Tax=Uliginosibacterium silvisoli TaxID=3114758 RepID=A0ABU6K873_9RHOO|nr:HAD-IIIC family phosphatase [Uliginosibacterium sp. H3]
MGADLLTELSWLQRPPADVSKRCRALVASPDDFGQRVRQLAAFALDTNNINRVAKAIAHAQQAGWSLAPLTPFSLGIVSNATTDMLVPALVTSAARHGIALTCVEADFDQVVQEALQADSRINRAQLDAVLIALDHRGLPLWATPGDADAAEATLKSALAHIETIRAGLRANGKSICIVQTVARPPEPLFGSFDMALPGSMQQLVARLNLGIAEAVTGSEDRLLDVAGLAETVGLANWHEPTQWNMAKLPFADACVPLYADRLAGLLGACKGKSRRCLVLDLDNTVWGGVIGDDGMDGIQIAQGDATGEAFLSVQRAALALRERGIVLAVSSKNTDEIARRVFREHPEMLLREEHIAVFQANWNDKASNIKAIAEELSLGLDSFVFLDDNPVERNLVRSELPQVAVPELPEDPALYARTLLCAGYFESVAFSEEDRQRAAFYQGNARRVSMLKLATDMDAYLASLAMVMTVQPFDETGRARIAQLISKSNQFNLTTRRYTEADVAAAAADANMFTLQVRLADSLGDNGMISVIICRPLGDDWDIDTWLMSCRVLGRKVEQGVLQEILTNARVAGVKRLLGSYIPTERNELVKEHYAKLGFSLLETSADGTTRWALDVASVTPIELPFVVQRPALSV